MPLLVLLHDFNYYLFYSPPSSPRALVIRYCTLRMVTLFYLSKKLNFGMLSQTILELVAKDLSALMLFAYLTES